GPRGGVEGAGPWVPPGWRFCGTASAVLRSGGCLVALLGAVDGGASDTEQVGQFGGAVLTGLQQADQMCFLPGIELGLLAAQPTLGLRYLYPFSGAQPDQVGLEPATMANTLNSSRPTGSFGS